MTFTGAAQVINDTNPKGNVNTVEVIGGRDFFGMFNGYGANTGPNIVGVDPTQAVGSPSYRQYSATVGGVFDPRRAPGALVWSPSVASRPGASTGWRSSPEQQQRTEHIGPRDRRPGQARPRPDRSGDTHVYERDEGRACGFVATDALSSPSPDPFGRVGSDGTAFAVAIVGNAVSPVAASSTLSTALSCSRAPTSWL